MMAYQTRRLYVTWTWIDIPCLWQQLSAAYLRSDLDSILHQEEEAAAEGHLLHQTLAWEEVEVEAEGGVDQA